MKIKETVGVTFLVVGLILVLNNVVELVIPMLSVSKVEFYIFIGIFFCFIGYGLSRD